MPLWGFPDIQKIDWLISDSIEDSQSDHNEANPAIHFAFYTGVDVGIRAAPPASRRLGCGFT